MPNRPKNSSHSHPLKIFICLPWMIGSLSLGLQLTSAVGAELDYQAPPLDNPLKGLV
ncbi:MAG: hypothetical protein ACI9UA_002471, partial [Pseudoalteromonas tetraodonis]